jgi:hypothetical protein
VNVAFDVGLVIARRSRHDARDEGGKSCAIARQHAARPANNNDGQRGKRNAPA